MPTLQIEHDVPNYNGWKKVFDSDPINRKQSGVNRYRIYKPFNDSTSVIVELDFDDINNLHSTLQAFAKFMEQSAGHRYVPAKNEDH